MSRAAFVLLMGLCATGEGIAGVQVAFTPGDAQVLVLDTLNRAQSHIDLAAYSFTSEQVVRALLAAQQRGVQVRVVVNAKTAGEKHGKTAYVASQGIAVRLNGQYSIQHNKFALIDRHTVQTGSANYTASAFSRNAENVVVIDNEPAVARAYQQAFEQLWKESNKSLNH